MLFPVCESRFDPWLLSPSTWSFFLSFSSSNLEFPVPAWRWTAGSRWEKNYKIKQLPVRYLCFYLVGWIIFVVLIAFCFLQETLLNLAWGNLENNTKTDLESQLNCCGLLNVTANRQQFEHDLQNCPAVSFKYPIFNHTLYSFNSFCVCVCVLKSTSFKACLHREQ